MHHAGLAPKDRKVVEELFVGRKIMVGYAVSYVAVHWAPFAYACTNMHYLGAHYHIHTGLGCELPCSLGGHQGNGVL